MGSRSISEPETHGKPNEPKSKAGKSATINILEDWALIEADFYREYRINLARDIGTFSWRQFLVFLNGLSPQSVVTATLQAREHERTKGGKVELIEDPELAEKRVFEIFR